MFLGQKLAALAFIIAAAWDPSAPSAVPVGFLTGGDYLQKSETERQGYIMGLIDGLFASAIIGSDPAALKRIKTCTLPLKSNQEMAIFDKYLHDNLQIWNHDANLLFVQSLAKVCPHVIWP